MDFSKRQEDGHELLTMGIIGCLPDNVQQAIKSFSIKPGKQFISFSFPAMENSVKKLLILKNRSWITHGLLLDRCPEVIQGFETIVTLVPQIDRSSHPVGLLTLNQKGSYDGIRNHLMILIQMILGTNSVHQLIQFPYIVLNFPDIIIKHMKNRQFLNEILLKTDSHANSIGALQDDVLRSSFISYRDLLQINIDEVVKHLRSMSSRSIDPGYFRRLLDLLQSSACTLHDFRNIHMYFMSPGTDQCVREFWQVWSHEQIACKVFPVVLSNDLKTLGILNIFSSVNEDNCVVSSTACITPHISVKDGLLNIIKCLKNQDIANTPPSSPVERRNQEYFLCGCIPCNGTMDSQSYFPKYKTVYESSTFRRPIPCYRSIPYFFSFADNKSRKRIDTADCNELLMKKYKVQRLGRTNWQHTNM